MRKCMDGAGSSHSPFMIKTCSKSALEGQPTGRKSKMTKGFPWWGSPSSRVSEESGGLRKAPASLLT